MSDFTVEEYQTLQKKYEKLKKGISKVLNVPEIEIENAITGRVNRE